MNNLSVSKKVYSDISERINTTLSFAPESAAEAMRIVDLYLAGETPHSPDQMAVIAFNMIRVELDRAMTRSSRARERARKRKEIAEIKSIITAMTRNIGETMEDDDEKEEESSPILISRRERRAMEQACSKKPKKKWKSLGVKKTII